MLDVIISSLIDGMIAATLSSLTMCIVCAWFEWRDKFEDA